MSINILMPALSPTMTEGKLAKWHVKVGDTVKSGQVVCEIETDKATMEVEAVDEGKIGQILVEEGTEGVAVNAVIAVLLEEGETEVAKSAAPAAEKPAPKAEEKPAEKPASPAPATAPAPAPKPAAPAASSGGTRIFASPLAKRIAAEKGIDLAGLKGSGPNGRIVKVDVENAKPGAAPATSQAPKAAAKAPAPPAGGQPVFVAPGDSRVPHTSIRKVIARRMLESKQTVPHFYLTVDFEIDALLTARTAINIVVEKKGTKVSVNDMVIKACAKALRDHPECNASWTEDEMIQYGAVDISVAVATDRGLITPIVRNADMKGLAQISIEMKDLASRAKSGKLKLEEFQGGGFTISNLGMFGIRDFGAIINTPQAMILAVGAGEERVVVRKGEMVVRNIMSCTLAVDHRVVDGAMGAQFLQTLKAYIEQPAAMLA